MRQYISIGRILESIDSAVDITAEEVKGMDKAERGAFGQRDNHKQGRVKQIMFAIEADAGIDEDGEFAAGFNVDAPALSEVVDVDAGVSAGKATQSDTQSKIIIVGHSLARTQDDELPVPDPDLSSALQTMIERAGWSGAVVDVSSEGAGEEG